MSREPCPSCNVHSPADAPSGSRISPCVGNRMSYPSVATIHLFSSLRPMMRQQFQISEKRFVTFGKIRSVRTPIILLGVYVKVIVACPRHVACHIVVPYALKVGTKWHAVRTRTCDKHIPSILEKQRIECRVNGTGLCKTKTGIDRKGGIL